jgi:hypothetical protein
MQAPKFTRDGAEIGDDLITEQLDVPRQVGGQ